MSRINITYLIIFETDVNQN